MAMALSPLKKTPQNIYKSLLTKTLCNVTSEITNDIISVFTKQPFSPDNPELKPIASKLNPKLVETVLNGFKSWKIAHTFFTWASNQSHYEHNIYTYNTMASILSRARQNVPLRALYLEVMESRCFMSPGALGFFIRCLGSVGLVHEANALFDQVQMMFLCVPNRYSYNCLLEACARSSSVDLVETRLNEMRDRGLAFDKYTLTPVLQVYCNAQKFDKALDVFNEIFRRGWGDSHVFSVLMVAFSKWGKVDKAFELSERMEDQDIRLNEKTFSVLIHGFVKESRVDKALLLFDKMKKSGFAPHISLYDALIGGLCANKDLEKALHLYSEMKELGIPPDVGIITKLIFGFSEGGELTRLSEEILGDLDSKSMILFYNSVLNSLVDDGSIDQAYHLLRRMMGDNGSVDVEIEKLFSNKAKIQLNTISFTIVIDGLIKVGKLDLALSLFRDMAQANCKADLRMYNNLIGGLCDSNRLDESYELVREMESSSFVPNHFTYNSIYGCLCRREDFVGALDTVKKMRLLGHEPWIKHSTLLVKRLCEHGKVVEACKFVADMVEEGFLPDIVAYSACLDGLVNIQELDLALKLFHDICARGYCPDVVAYNIVIKGLCKAQRFVEAQSYFNEMMTKNLTPSVVTYNLLIDGFCKNGCIDEAMLCLSRMLQKEREPNVITYTTLIDGLCNAGRPDDAVVLWNQMREKGCVPTSVAFMAFIHGLCKCSRPSAALVQLCEMEEKDIKADTYVYVALISAFLADSNLPLALEILKKMVNRGKFPDSLDKNYLVVTDAILKLSKDARTSSSIKNLIMEGSIPTLSLLDT